MYTEEYIEELEKQTVADIFKGYEELPDTSMTCEGG
jgi:hypothetical protein